MSEAVLVFEELGPRARARPAGGDPPRRVAARRLGAGAGDGSRVVGLVEAGRTGHRGRAPRVARRPARARRRPGSRRIDPSTVAADAGRPAARRAHARRRSSTGRPARRRAGRRCRHRRRVAARSAWCSPPRCSSGMCEATVELATAYAKEREQFGRPIGQFQAVKHLCADMLVARRGRARRGVRGRRSRSTARATTTPARAAAAGQGDRRRRRPVQRQDRHPGARRHGLHVGGRRPALLEAGLRARHPLRQQRRARRGRRHDCSDGEERRWESATDASSSSPAAGVASAARTRWRSPPKGRRSSSTTSARSLSGEGTDARPAQEVVNEIERRRRRGGRERRRRQRLGRRRSPGRSRRSTRSAASTPSCATPGIVRDRMLVNMSVDEWDAVIRVHLRGMFCPVRHADRLLAGRVTRPARPSRPAS